MEFLQRKRATGCQMCRVLAQMTRRGHVDRARRWQFPRSLIFQLGNWSAITGKERVDKDSGGDTVIKFSSTSATAVYFPKLLRSFVFPRSWVGSVLIQLCSTNAISVACLSKTLHEMQDHGPKNFLSSNMSACFVKSIHGAPQFILPWGNIQHERDCIWLP